MAKEEELYALNLEGFWMDVGQPKDYLAGTYIYLNHLRMKDPKCLAVGENILGNVLIVRLLINIKILLFYLFKGSNSSNIQTIFNWSGCYYWTRMHNRRWFFILY